MPNATHYAQTEPHPAQLITIHAVAAPTRKRRGEAAEAAFLARATALGFSVCIPWGDSNRYDSSVVVPFDFHRSMASSPDALDFCHA